MTKYFKRVYDITLLIIIIGILPFTNLYGQSIEIDSIKKAIATMPFDTNKAKAYYDLSKLFLSVREFDLIHKYLDSGLVIHKQFNNSNGIGSGYFLHGYAYRKGNNTDSAIIFYMKSIPYFKGNKSREALAYESIGASYDACSKYDSALIYFNIAFKKAIANTDTTQQIRIITNIGAIYYYQSKYKEAAENYFKALRIGEAMKDSEVMAANYLNIANVFALLGDSKKSIEYSFLGFEITNATGDFKKSGNAYENIASEYLKNKQNEDAFKYATQALIFYKKASAFAEAALCCNTISDYYTTIADSNSNLGNKKIASLNYQLADSILKEGYGYAIESEDNYALVNILINSGDLNERLGRYKIAIKNYDDAIRYCKELDLNKELAKAYKNIAAIYNRTNQSEKAYQFLRMSMQLSDSTNSQDNLKTIAELNTKYESEKKEQRITLLKKENQLKTISEQKEHQKKNFAYIAISALIVIGIYVFNLYSKRKKLSNQLSQSLTDLKSTQQQLIQLEKEKEAENIRVRISRDIHDDIGHNLTKISLLSNMTANATDKNTAEAKENLDRISDYSRNVNSSLSEIVWAITPKHDTLESLIIYMRNHIHKFFEGTGISYKINFTDDFENRNVNPDLKRNIFLVLKESLNNILKYAQAKNVVVAFNINGDDFELLIKDDGVGFSPLSLGEGQGLRSGNGLQNMHYRMQQSGGTFHIHSSLGNGCEIVANGLF